MPSPRENLEHAMQNTIEALDKKENLLMNYDELVGEMLAAMREEGLEYLPDCFQERRGKLKRKWQDADS